MSRRPQPPIPRPQALHENLTSIPLFAAMLMHGIVTWHTGPLPKAGALMAGFVILLSVVLGLRGVAPRAAQGRGPWPRWFTITSALMGLSIVLGSPAARPVRFPVAAVVAAVAVWLVVAQPRRTKVSRRVPDAGAAGDLAAAQHPSDASRRHD